jgi:hypothetical protein
MSAVMFLSNEYSDMIFLMGYSNYRYIAEEFDQKPPEHAQITYSIEAEVISKFKQNGIIHDTHIHCKRRYVY